MIYSNDELTPNQAAAYLGISRPLLVKLLDDGIIPARTLPGSRHRRIVVADRSSLWLIDLLARKTGHLGERVHAAAITLDGLRRGNVLMAEADPSGFDTIAGRPDYYIEFLDARTSIDDERRVKQVVVGLLQAQDGLAVLDVGTGTGDDARELAGLVGPRGRVVGVDRSSDMVAEARRRAADSGLPIEFVEGDAQALDFPDASFDRCRAERVLIHLPDPAAAVREMARVTRPGGLVVVSDLDGETIFVNSSNRQLTRDLIRGITDDFANGWVGRHLQRYFIEAGLVDVRCVTSVIQNSVAFTRMVFAGRLKMMVDAGQTTSEDVHAFWAELDQGEREGWLCSGVICFNVVGHKPAI